MKDAAQRVGDAMEYTLTMAADTAGKSKSAIHRAIQKGRLSARKLEDGTLRIDASELARVYPPSTTGQASGQSETPEPTLGTATAVLETKVQGLEDKVKILEEQVARERGLVEDFQKLLARSDERFLALVHRPVVTPVAAAPERPVEAPTVAPVVAEPVQPPRGLLARLLGR